MVTGLLLRGSPAAGPSRLCILGAGNCNDVHLGALLSSHREIHLVDLDAESLARAVARQGLGGNPAIRLDGDVDVSGMLDTMADWTPLTEIRTADLTACVEEPLRRLPSALTGPFEMVASTCILSQLIDAAVQSVGEQHPRFVELLQAIRAGHLRLLTHLIAPGGTGVLITDFVSSDSFPDLGLVAEEKLTGVLARLIHERNFFHGVNPAVLISLFHTDQVLASQVASLELIPPWRWNLGPRLYAVFGLKIRKRIGAR